MNKDRFFCVSCGNQLTTIDEISQGVCKNCENSFQKIKNEGDFFCWACGKKLATMSEIAQGVCTKCKHKIIETLHAP